MFGIILLLLSVAFALCVCQFHCFLLLDGEDSTVKQAQQIIQPVAEHYFKMEEPPVLFFYTKGDEISDSLRDFLPYLDEENDNVLVILNIPNQRLYISEVSAESLTREAVEKFVTDFTYGKLEGKALNG